MTIRRLPDRGIVGRQIALHQGIGLESDDFLQIVITFGTNALYGRSVDFVNTWGSAAVWVS